jgi:hypothetical protein
LTRFQEKTGTPPEKQAPDYHDTEEKIVPHNFNSLAEYPSISTGSTKQAIAF